MLHMLCNGYTCVFKFLGVFCKCFIRILQVFYLFSEVCCKCFIWMLQKPTATAGAQSWVTMQAPEVDRHIRSAASIGRGRLLGPTWVPACKHGGHAKQSECDGMAVRIVGSTRWARENTRRGLLSCAERPLARRTGGARYFGAAPNVRVLVSLDFC
jgi:hypothetical protein